MKKCLAFILIFLGVFLSASLVQGADQSKEPPRVIATNPANGDVEVDPTLSKITVSFDRPMLNKSWSWSHEDKKSFPQVNGQPFYTENGTTCVLPVRLEPGKRYIIWINTTRFKNFKDTNGVAAEPYRIEFRTK
jgi:hypothetical protein